MHYSQNSYPYIIKNYKKLIVFRKAIDFSRFCDIIISLSSYSTQKLQSVSCGMMLYQYYFPELIFVSVRRECFKRLDCNLVVCLLFLKSVSGIIFSISGGKYEQDFQRSFPHE